MLSGHLWLGATVSGSTENVSLVTGSSADSAGGEGQKQGRRQRKGETAGCPWQGLPLRGQGAMGRRVWLRGAGGVLGGLGGGPRT